MAILAPPEPQSDIEPKQELVMGIETADAIEPKPPAVAALNIEHLTKQFEVGGRRKKKTVTAVNDISLRIEKGEIYGLLGANGSGKSTFIRLVSTLLTVEHGLVEIFGHDITREEMAVKRLINRVSVDAAFFKKLSPTENLMYAARLYGARRRLCATRDRSHPGQARDLRVPPRPAARADEPRHAAEGGHRQGLPDEPRAVAAGRAHDGTRPAFQARGPGFHRGDP